MSKKTQAEMAPVSTEVEVINKIHNQFIVETTTGQTTQDYLYSIKQGGRVVKSVTLAGINEADNLRGGIQVKEIIYKETDNFRYGAYEQPKLNSRHKDPFAFTKALHKAQQNAIKQLLPVPVIREVLNFYLKRNVDTADIEQQPQAEQTNDTISNAQKAAFAIAKNLEPSFEKVSISKNDFWNYVKVKFSVESRNDMSEQQWTEFSAQLKAAETVPQLFEALINKIRTIRATHNGVE